MTTVTLKSESVELLKQLIKNDMDDEAYFNWENYLIRFFSGFKAFLLKSDDQITVRLFSRVTKRRYLHARYKL